MADWKGYTYRFEDGEIISVVALKLDLDDQEALEEIHGKVKSISEFELDIVEDEDEDEEDE